MTRAIQIYTIWEPDLAAELSAKWVEETSSMQTPSSPYAAPPHRQSGSYSWAKSIPGPDSGKKRARTSTADPQRSKSNTHPLTSCKEGNWKHNRNQNLCVHIPTVASISTFIRNVDNSLGNPVPTGTTVIKKKKPQWPHRASFINSSFYHKAPSFKQGVIRMTQDTF